MGLHGNHEDKVGRSEPHPFKTNDKMKATRSKKTIPAFYPQKKWLTSQEACVYLNMSVGKFSEIAKKLTTSAIGTTKYYRVSQLDSLLEKNIIINHD